MVKSSWRVFAGILLCLAGLAAQAEVEVTIDRNPVQVNESFQLVFSLDHEPDQNPDFSILQQHFLILGSNRSNNISIINGQYQRSVKWTLQLMAKQVGDYMIPAIRFGQERSEPFQITVNPSSISSLPHDELVFEVIARQSEIYVQSQVIVKLRLLSANNISAYQFGDLRLQSGDAVIEPLGDVQDYQTRIADRNYLVLEQRFALYPQQSGRLEIAPIMAEVRLPSGSGFDPFRTGGEVRRVRSQPVFIDVKPIPPEADGAYWLPATKLVLREEIPENLDALVVGEPITRSLSIVAEGLTAAQLPQIELPPIDGLKQYPDQPELRDRRSGKGVTGRRTQKVALIPSAPGAYLLPEISLQWWNLHSGRLETATLPMRELNVGGVAGSAPEPSRAAGEEVAGADPGSAQARASRFWVWTSLILALGWSATVLLWWFGTRRTGLPALDPGSIAPLRTARRDLHRACLANDAPDARTALLAWGRALLAPRPLASLHQLERELGGDFGRELARLNHALYAAEHGDWQGIDLWQCCQALESERNVQPSQAASGLTPLNP